MESFVAMRMVNNAWLEIAFLRRILTVTMPGLPPGRIVIAVKKTKLDRLGVAVKIL
jgi:hypothetical protein